MNPLHWTPDKWSAFGNVLLALAAIVAGGWALYNYRKRRRLEAAKWLKELFSEFYIEDTFSNVRALFEYNYTDILGPLLERRITDRHISISTKELDLLRELDTLLNYFEYLLYLEEEGHLSKKDRKAVFEYWFDLMNKPHSGGLRRYAARFGFERIANALDSPQTEYLALYGSLMLSVGGLDDLDVNHDIEYYGPCKIEGHLFDLGAYPGLSLGGGIVLAELYLIKNISVFRKLDKFERYSPNDYESSLYLRRCIRLLEPDEDAWVYVYNQDINDKKLIRSGDWKAYLEAKSA